VSLPDGRADELKTHNAYAASAEAQIPISNQLKKCNIFVVNYRLT